MNAKLLKIVGTVGLVAPFLVLVCVLLSVVSWSQFSWTNNALSDLGVQAGITAILFNGALIFGGLFLSLFALGIFNLVKKQLMGKIGSGLLTVAFIAFTAIGIFNESFSPTHQIVAVTFFVVFPCALIFLSRSFWLLGEKKLGLFTIVSALTAALPWILLFIFPYVPGVAIPEFLSGIIVATWVMTLSYSMQQKYSHKQQTT